MSLPNKSKRTLKSSVTFQVELKEEQKKVLELIKKFEVVVVEGIYGTGKSFSAVASAIDQFRNKKYNKIVITRAFIPDKGLGALPGEIESKLTFEMQPIIDNFETAQGVQQTKKMLQDGEIKIQYNGKVKGSTVTDAIYLIDEGQDLTWQGFKDLLTRLGKTSRMIITLSKEQIHHSVGKDSCYFKLLHLKNSDLIGWAELTETNHRNEIINKIIDSIDGKDPN